MFDGKLKAVTFSYDDGVTQDKRLIEILNRYNLKGTFNLNSGGLGKAGTPYMCPDGRSVRRDRIAPEEIISVYKGHEVAAHTVNHLNLTELDEEKIIFQVESDRLKLSDLCGYEVVGMAYPCGGVNNDERVADIIRKKTGIKYSRTITSSHSFEPQTDLIRFNPTVYHRELDRLFELAGEFTALKPEKPQILYIWGHSYEFDSDNMWEEFERLCKIISGRDDVFYGTNSQVLLGDINA